MAHVRSTSAPRPNFNPIFNVALDAYRERTKQDLVSHPLFARLQVCDSSDAVITVLREQIPEFTQSHNTNGRFTKWLVPTVNVLFVFSGMLGEGAGLAFSPAKAIFAGVGVLLLAAKHVLDCRDTLIGLFIRIDNFFKRLEIYTRVSPTAAMTSIMVDIMVEVISLLGIVTKEIKQCRMKNYLMKLIGNRDVEDALQRLDNLTKEEALMASAELQRSIHSVNNGVQGIKRVVEDVDNRVQGVHGKVENINKGVKDVRSTVQAVEFRLQGIDHKVQDVDDKVQGVHNEVYQGNLNCLRDSFRTWLSPPNPSINHNLLCDARHKGTTEWFSGGKNFDDWKSSGSCLWIHGKPGSGKSVLCSAIIQDVMSLRESGEASVAYFYFDFKDDNKQRRCNLLPSLLVQLSARSDLRCDILARLHSAHDRGVHKPSDRDMTTCLIEMLSLQSHGPTYIILDAMDECPNTSGIPSPRKEILGLVKELVDLRIPNLHICVTSRPEVDIQLVLRPLASHHVSLHDESGQKQAIVDYVGYVVHSDDSMQRWREEDRGLVIKTLSEKADGMFRWVFCLLEILRQTFPQSVRRVLEELPESLDETYERVLMGINKANQRIAHRLLQCLVVAVHPLRIEELAEVLAVDFDVEGAPILNPDWRWPDQEKAVMFACSSLVAITNDGDSKSRIVHFSHFSVKEYLMSNRLMASSSEVSCYHIQLEPAHTILAQACLGVLLQLDNRVGRDSIQSFPLARYAAQYWVEHAGFGNVASCIKDGMDCLFDADKSHFSTWLAIYDEDSHSSPGMRPSKSKPKRLPLYYAGLFGFRGLAQRLLKKHPEDIHARGGYHGTPLHASASTGHVDVSSLLIEHFPDVDIRGIWNQTALHRAARQGHLEIGRLLLRRGANVNAKDKSGWTPLHSAAIHGQVEFAQMLLDHDAAVNAANKCGMGPLHLASIRRQVGVMRLLLECGANPRARDSLGSTPCEIASRSSYRKREIVQLLSEYGVEGFQKLLYAHGHYDVLTVGNRTTT